MRLHPHITGSQTAEFQDALLKLALDKKLDKIDFTDRYDVVKSKAKNKSNTIKDSGPIIGRGNPYLVGNEKAVALYFLNSDEFFRTSEILKCTQYKKFIKVETLNSVYKLYPWK